MPVSKQKPPTQFPEGSTPECASTTRAEQEEFRQHVRRLAVGAVQVLIEQVMREELEQCIGAEWGECTPTRRGYRNGSYTRESFHCNRTHCRSEACEDDREGEFHTQVFERYNRYEPEVAEALTQMDVAWSQHTTSVGEIAQELMGVAKSASAVSRLNQSLTEQFETRRERPLLSHYRILYLDGIYLSVRHGDQTDSTIILTALGVDLEGNKDVLAWRSCAEENKDGWSCLLQDLRRRGAAEIDLIVTDGHDGRLSAVSALFPATLRKPCLVHKQRNVMNAIPQREQKEVATELAGIFKHEQQEDALLNLAASTRQIPPALPRSHSQPL